MPQTGSGVLTGAKSNNAVLIEPADFTTQSTGIMVPQKLVKEFNLVEGVSVSGPIRKNKKGISLEGIDTICGLTPDKYRRRKSYTQLTAVTPYERFKLSAAGEPAMRVVDLIAPVAKGTRGLIVSPPRAGKTILLEQIARGIRKGHPDARLIALLVDERPEEVTHFRRQVDAEVLASSNDCSTREHIALIKFAMSHITAELECGRDVVVLVDSLTRIARAFNLKGSKKTKGRIMSGGIQAGVLETPRRFFGMARSIEGGGSVTILATVLVDTGSRMDQLIFEEFKGTGNCEIILDRKLAEARVFPAINLLASGSRREENLFAPNELEQINRLRRALTKVKTREGVELLLKFLKRYPTNDDFLKEDPQP